MSYGKKKEERYQNFGGINTKASRYLTGVQQAIALVNYDFSRVGSLTKRPDTSEFLGASFGVPIKSLFEFNNLSGSSYMLVQSSTGLFSQGSFGVTHLQIPTYFLSTIIDANRVEGLTGHADMLAFADNAVIADQWAYLMQLSGGVTGNPWWARYFGGSILNVQMTQPGGLSFPFSGSTFSTNAAGYFVTQAGYRYSAALLNERDTAGTVNSIPMAYAFAGYGVDRVTLDILNPLSNAATPQVGASYFLVFREDFLGVEGFTTVSNQQDGVPATTAVFKVPMSLWGVTTKMDDTGATTDPYLLAGASNVYRQNHYFPFNDLDTFGMTNVPINDFYAVKDTGFPTIISVYNNMLICSGFYKYPSTVFWGQLGMFEWFDNEDFAEIRTDDGDKLRCQINYDGQLIMGKQFSIHAMTGYDPDTITLQEKTISYGIMNNRSACVWENKLWFLDGSGKGVAQYNGANTTIVSDAVESFFNRLNLNAAYDEAFMIHVKGRNEVWCGIPIDGAELVNCIVIYDYDAKGWTTFDGLSPTAVAIARGTLDRAALVMGFEDGRVRSFNTLYTGAEAVTTSVRFPFVSNFGWSTTETYRYLFLDVDPVLGVTHSFSAKFYLDQSDTPSLTRMISTSLYQTRTDFGLPGKGLSVELTEGSSLPLRLNGYTVASRFQRNV